MKVALAIAAVLTGAVFAVVRLAPARTSTDRSLALKGDWLNAKPGEVDKARLGKVTIVHFFTFGCSNCKANVPYYNQWKKGFGSDVVLVGVHTPETDDEKDETRVKDAVQSMEITYPVLLDPRRVNWKAWGLRYWPTIFVIDKKGVVREKWEGELQYDGQQGYEHLTSLVQKLIKE